MLWDLQTLSVPNEQFMVLYELNEPGKFIDKPFHQLLFACLQVTHQQYSFGVMPLDVTLHKVVVAGDDDAILPQSLAAEYFIGQWLLARHFQGMHGIVAPFSELVGKE